jgi:uncharacterized membrane protein YhaH (DUF805 family)
MSPEQAPGHAGFAAHHRSLTERMVEGAARIMRPLFKAGDFTGREDRGAFLAAMVTALALLLAGRTMDLLIFDALPGIAPLFFAAVVGLGLILTLPALCIRRLHDAGTSGWLILLALVPVIGWLALGWMMLQPTSFDGVVAGVR